MKKIYAILALACSTLTASAQSTLVLSTYQGTNIAKFDGLTKDISMNRYVFHGWNTISLPVDMSAEEVEEAFGSDCKLERLIGVEKSNGQINLNFQDVKSEGITANVPYILHISGDTRNVKINLSNKTVDNSEAEVTFFVQGSNERVTFAAAKTHISAEGLYGILAKDNGEASFVNVGNISNGFFATRCFVKVEGSNNAVLNTIHVNDATTITSVLANDSERTDVYNLSGALVRSNASMSDINGLQKGIYVVKGKKIIVK